MVRFFTVLRSGEYKGRAPFLPAYVYALHDQIKRYYTKQFSFHCLTDFTEVENGVALRHDFPGWWSKIEVFRFPFKFGETCVYIDLDTVITGDITPLVNRIEKAPNGSFFGLQDFPPPSRKGVDYPEPKLGSGLMGWVGDQRDIYQAFVKNPVDAMTQCRVKGDQQFINIHRPEFFRLNQRGSGIFSYKFSNEFVDKGILPDAATIICFHGHPKPWEVRHKWVPDYSLYDKAGF